MKSAKQILEEASLREDRKVVAYEACVTARRLELRKCYMSLCNTPQLDDYDHNALPNLYDGIRLFDDLINIDNYRIPIDSDTFCTIVNDQQLYDRLDDYADEVEDTLGHLVPADSLDHGHHMDDSLSDIDSRLQQPNAMFVCLECLMFALPWPAINGHWREEHEDQSIWADESHNNLRVKWWREGRDLVDRILDVVGLKDSVCTMESLDELVQAGRLYCSCGDPLLPEPSKMSWCHLVRDLTAIQHVDGLKPCYAVLRQVFHIHSHLKMNELRMDPSYVSCSLQYYVSPIPTLHQYAGR